MPFDSACDSDSPTTRGASHWARLNASSWEFEAVENPIVQFEK